MEVKDRFSKSMERLKSFFFKKSSFSSKTELNLSAFKWVGLCSVLAFVLVVLLIPDELPVQFVEKIESSDIHSVTASQKDGGQRNSSSAQLWSSPKPGSYSSGGSGSAVNHNTAMVLGSSENAKNQLPAGARLPLRILDKVLVSQEVVPVLAELIVDSQTESGLRLAAGTRFYGEASFMKGSNRAVIVFKQISLRNGQMKEINAKALGKDGQGGVPGRVYSDGVKNSAGQVITSFVGGLAGGSIKTDVFGHSQGGIENGILSAVAETARAKAQGYGEKLKAEREWLEVRANEECDAQLFDSMNLQSGSSIER